MWFKLSKRVFIVSTFRVSDRLQAIRLASICLCCLLFSGCSAWQVSSSFSGATEQRLLTYSINQLANQLPSELATKITNKKVHMTSNFIKPGPASDYLVSRMRAEMEYSYKVQWMENASDADFHLNMFITSLGTDQDNIGVFVPIPIRDDETGEVATIEILTLKMFHGISEMYFYLTDMKTQKIERIAVPKSTVRTDRIATPIFTIPLNFLKLK